MVGLGNVDNIWQRKGCRFCNNSWKCCWSNKQLFCTWYFTINSFYWYW
jgi:hypothetical protein